MRPILDTGGWNVLIFYVPLWFVKQTAHACRSQYSHESLLASPLKWRKLRLMCRDFGFIFRRFSSDYEAYLPRGGNSKKPSTLPIFMVATEFRQQHLA